VIDEEDVASTSELVEFTSASTAEVAEAGELTEEPVIKSAEDSTDSSSSSSSEQSEPVDDVSSSSSSSSSMLVFGRADIKLVNPVLNAPEQTVKASSIHQIAGEWFMMIVFRKMTILKVFYC
jgi:hypothetical protein